MEYIDLINFYLYQFGCSLFFNNSNNYYYYTE